MSKLPISIPRQPALKPAEDYYRLRRDGIGYIAQMGSRRWTDYNTHDPGITVLEGLCYAITDIAYRVGRDIKDILAPETAASGQSQPYPNQAFFTARNILTVNPTTPDDLRRMLIDLDGVRNAWVFCRECSCNGPYYAWCEKEQLQLSYQKPDGQLTQAPIKVEPRGLYDIALELESDPELGDLNDHKIEQIIAFNVDDAAYSVLLEVRFPGTKFQYDEEWLHLLEKNDASADFSHTIHAVRLTRLGTTKTTDIFAEIADESDRSQYLRKHWNTVWHMDVEMTFAGPQSGQTIYKINNATLRLFSDAAAKAACTAAIMKVSFDAANIGGRIVDRYRGKMFAARSAVSEAKKRLQEHRGLDEDPCRVNVVGIEDVAVCADVEVRPDADIERVQAHIWFKIEQYFNPPIPFYAMQELIDAGEAVEDIFNGPALDSGFLKDDDLEAASLKSELRVSDIVNRLMDIDGVITVNRVQLVKYDREGHAVGGAADPQWGDGGLPIFDASKTTALWLMYIGKQRQLRLYRNASKFLFLKNGLPFAPRMDEALDTLTQLRGEAERPKMISAAKDLAPPVGTFRGSEEYFPVQYSFPLAYGIGTEGLPSHATASRRAQAKQLKAYLMVFEQILGNAIAQVGHAADLFSLDPAVRQTYFVREFSGAVIQGYDEIVNGLDKTKLEALLETAPEYLERRNRFLDHIMARFGEQFSEYALLLTNLEGEQVALDRLIDDKISFVKDYPEISADRGKAFNYSAEPSATNNVSGLQKRLGRLLGWRSDERMILVEHLLLRPKFPGDALYPACSDGVCGTCGDEDPYSFRLTFVMPGWTAPYDRNLEMRGFADRTIRQETPAHLLAKICWVGNDDFAEDPCDPVIDKVAELLESKGRSAGSETDTEKTCECAAAVYHAFSGQFKAWYNDKILLYHHPVTLKADLEKLFAEVNRKLIPCAAKVQDKVWERIVELLVSHFQQRAQNGWQFDRFAEAWSKWLEANSRIDWMEERLQERVELLLAANLTAGVEQGTATSDKVCECAADALAQYGSDFYAWMQENIKSGKLLKEFGELPDFPSPVLCDSFNPRAAVLIKILLKERYAGYVEVSYRLWVVVDLLGRLFNKYPAATLHDCDEGNDENPARLDQTALGS